MATNRAFAVEDGNITSSSFVTSRSKNYVDIDLSFNAKTNGDIFKKVDAGAVKQAVKNILTTGFTEKPFAPNFGGGVGDALFENMDDGTAFEIEQSVIASINNYEPRAIIDKIDISDNPDNNAIDVTIRFGIANVGELVTVTTSLSRLR
jgi:phage baseplate assembly protein W